MMTDLMAEHGLAGWRFEFDNSVRRFGCCFHGRRTLTLSRKLTYLNDVSIVRNTMLHEIAHAMVGAGHGHDYTWKATARRIGCTGDRCYEEAAVATPEAAWIGTCPGCGSQSKRHRLTEKAKRVACKKCCIKFANGRYDGRFQYRWLRNQAAFI